MTIRFFHQCFVVFCLTAAILLASLVVAPCEVVFAAAVKKPIAGKAAKTSAGGGGVVVTETTQIYQKPDLDAAVIAVVKRGVHLPISKGTRGDYAKFFRTRVSGKLGWILTTDIKSEAVAKKILTQAKAAEYKRGPFAPEPDEAAPKGKNREKEMFMFTKSVSFAIGMNDYKESINGSDYTANLLTYGMKLTGPDIFLTGPLMDVNLLLHYGAPDYYNQLSKTKPSGFILWTDANLLLPLMLKQDTLIGIGAGPILVISNIQASQGTQDYGMWSFNVGADIELTAGIRFDEFCIRIDGKYIFENKTYKQIQLSLGTIF